MDHADHALRTLVPFCLSTPRPCGLASLVVIVSFTPISVLAVVVQLVVCVVVRVRVRSLGLPGRNSRDMG